MPARIDIAGQRYGKLFVTHSVRLPNKRWGVVCVCDCGAVTTTDQGHLRSGNTTSCGCHKRSVLPNSTTKHGYGREGKQGPEYRIWKAMRNRCNNPKAPRYKDYGGRGIKVCKRWNNFANFLADMGERPEGLTLDRKNNNGNYTPKNCRWTTWKVQANNQRGRV